MTWEGSGVTGFAEAMCQGIAWVLARRRRLKQSERGLRMEPFRSLGRDISSMEVAVQYGRLVQECIVLLHQDQSVGGSCWRGLGSQWVLLALVERFHHHHQRGERSVGKDHTDVRDERVYR